MKKLEKEFHHYINNQSDYVKLYKGKFLVFVDEHLDGVYDSEIEAYRESLKKHSLGTFLIQECQEGEDNYTQTFRTRVKFD
jgi:hypothetical protein